jgi:hypothetical protein
MAEAVLLAAGVQATTAATWAAWINVALAVAGSAYAAKEQRRRARNAKREAARDRELTVRSAAPNLVSIYGQTRVGGHLVDVFTTGPHQQYLHQVYRLADHQCADITALWFAGQRLVLDGNGFVTNPELTRRTPFEHNVNLASNGAGVLTLPAPSASELVITSGAGEWITSYSHTIGTTTVSGLVPGNAYLVAYTSTLIEPLIRIRAHLGQPGQVADADLIAESAGRWTSTMRGDGITYVYPRMEFDPILSPFDAEDWLFEVRGKLVRDPRGGLPPAWSNNAQLVATDWLTDTRLGPGIAPADVPDAETVAGANVSDELVRTQAISDIPIAGYYEPFVTGVGGWFPGAGSGTTLSNNGDGTIRIASTGADQIIAYSPISVSGVVHRYVRARVKRVAGNQWDGRCYYSTVGHGFDAGIYKQIPLPTFADNGWGVAEWDMYALTAGGTDWSTNTITGLRLDLGIASGDVWDVDWIAIGGSIEQRRYTCDIAITSAQTRGDISDQLMDACAGTLVYAQGRWLVRPGAHRLPALTIDERTVVGEGETPVKVAPVPARRARYNAVRAYYRGPETNYTDVAAPIVRNPQYVAEDGGVEVVQDLRLAHNCDSTRAQRLAKIELERHRQGLTCAVTTNLRAYDLVPTDVCAVNLSLPGFANKAFVVDSRSWAGAGTLQYTLTETAAQVWEWNDGNATIGDPAPNTVLRSPSTPPAPIEGLSISASDEHRLRLSDDTYLRRLRISWNPIADTYVTQGGFVELELWEPPNPTVRALPPEPGDAIDTYIAPVPDGLVAVRARAVNALGRRGLWRAQVIDAAPSTIAGSTPILMDSFNPLAPSIQASWQRSTTGVVTTEIFRLGDPIRPIDQPFRLLAWSNQSDRPYKVALTGHWTGRAVVTNLVNPAVRVDMRATITTIATGAVVSIDPPFTAPTDNGSGFTIVNPPAAPPGLLPSIPLRGDVSRQYDISPGQQLVVGAMFYAVLPAHVPGQNDELVAELQSYLVRGEARAA